MSDDKAHITWFSFEGEFVCDYPTFLYGRPSQATIEAMVPSRVLRVTGQQLEQFFNQNMETMKLRAIDDNRFHQLQELFGFNAIPFNVTLTPDGRTVRDGLLLRAAEAGYDRFILMLEEMKARLE